MQILRSRADIPCTLQTVVLDDVTYKLRLTWRGYCEAWYCDLLTALDVPILTGVRVEPGANLLLLADSDLAPAGALLAVPTGRNGDTGTASEVLVGYERKITIVAAVNDTIDMICNGAPGVATIAPGTYQWSSSGGASDMHVALDNALTAAFADNWTVVSTLAGVMGIRNYAGHAFTILWLTGVGTAPPEFFGFDGLSDVTSAAFPPVPQTLLSAPIVATPSPGHVFLDGGARPWTPTATTTLVHPTLKRQGYLRTMEPMAAALGAGASLTPLVPPTVGLVVTAETPAVEGAYAEELLQADLGNGLALVYVTAAEVAAIP